MTGDMHSLCVRMDSVEELSQALQGSVWDLDMHQLEVGKAPASIDAVATSTSLLMKTTLSGRTHQLGSLDKASYTFGLPAFEQAPVKFGNNQYGADTLTLFDSAGGLDAVSERGFCAYTASFDAAEFETLVDQLGLDITAFRAGHGSRHIQVAPDLARALRASMAQLLETGASVVPTDLAKPQDLQIALASGLATAFPGARETADDSGKNRARALRAALAHIHDNTDESLSIEHLCAVSACSISTLERSFRERFGISPKRYLMAVRLSGVRKALLASPKEESVGDIAASMGFWHMSKMAADYKRMFGELPSHTRRPA